MDSDKKPSVKLAQKTDDNLHKKYDQEKADEAAKKPDQAVTKPEPAKNETGRSPAQASATGKY